MGQFKRTYITKLYPYITTNNKVICDICHYVKYIICLTMLVLVTLLLNLKYYTLACGIVKLFLMSMDTNILKPL